jgi:hypothetical protein
MRFTVLLAAGVCLPLSAAAQQERAGQASRPGWPCAGKIDPAYVQVSEATGGKVLLFHPSEVEGAAADERASRQHRETVFRAAGQIADESYELAVPIDSTIESAYFSVSVQCLQLVTLLTPSGQELAIGSGGVEYHQFESIRMFVVPRPATGLWRVVAAGRGFFSVIVSARTDLRLQNVRLADHDGALDRAPATSLEATVSGPLRHAGFHLVEANGSSIQAIGLRVSSESPDVRHYGGFVTRPRADFRVAVSGIDANGFQFQRMESRLMPGRAPSR